MEKIYLFTPGPTTLPPEVLQSQSLPIIHHRTKEYSAVFEEMNEGLKYLFQTENDVLTFASSGTGAMEASVVNTLSPGDKALVVKGGKFGERWAGICEVFGVEVVPIDLEWGDAVDPQVVEDHLKKNSGIKAVLTTLCETSTGTLTDIRAIGEMVRKTNALLIVDAVSGLGADDMPADKWGVDICVAGSQKGMMTPPGLAFCSVSEKAWKAEETSSLPKYYWSFKESKKALGKGQTPYTPPVSLVVGLKTALDMIREEGVENVVARHARLAEACRAGVKALGLELLSKKPANALTAVKAPEGVDGEALKGTLDKKYGVKVAGGQAKLKGKIIRFAHLGYSATFDMITAISALEFSLRDLGYQVDLGAGVKAAQEVLHQA